MMSCSVTNRRRVAIRGAEERQRMITNDAVKRLQTIAETLDHDPEVAHVEADAVLLDLINNKDVRAAFEHVRRWYA